MDETDKKGFPFADAPDTAAIVCRHVLEEGAPVTYVSHDEDDGMWQVLCGGLHETADARLVSLYSVWKRDESVGGLCEMRAPARRAVGASGNGEAPDAAD